MENRKSRSGRGEIFPPLKPEKEKLGIKESKEVQSKKIKQHLLLN